MLKQPYMVKALLLQLKFGFFNFSWKIIILIVEKLLF